jgi:hypothetical protein
MHEVYTDYLHRGNKAQNFKLGNKKGVTQRTIDGKERRIFERRTRREEKKKLLASKKEQKNESDQKPKRGRGRPRKIKPMHEEHTLDYQKRLDDEGSHPDMVGSSEIQNPGLPRPDGSNQSFHTEGTENTPNHQQFQTVRSVDPEFDDLFNSLLDHLAMPSSSHPNIQHTGVSFSQDDHNKAHQFWDPGFGSAEITTRYTDEQIWSTLSEIVSEPDWLAVVDPSLETFEM